jgi:hypothetical protein
MPVMSTVVLIQLSVEREVDDGLALLQLLFPARQGQQSGQRRQGMFVPHDALRALHRGQLHLGQSPVPDADHPARSIHAGLHHRQQPRFRGSDRLILLPLAELGSHFHGVSHRLGIAGEALHQLQTAAQQVHGHLEALLGQHGDDLVGNIRRVVRRRSRHGIEDQSKQMPLGRLPGDQM